VVRRQCLRLLRLALALGAFALVPAVATAQVDPGTPVVTIPGPPVDTTPVADSAPHLDWVAPVLSRLSLTYTRFRIGKPGTAVATRAVLGTTIRFMLSEDATVTFIFERVRSGQAVGSACVAPSAARTNAKSCKRYSVIENALTRQSLAGANLVSFSGRIGALALKPGAYRLGLIATDARNNRSPIEHLAFTVVTN
jgi:hypothetical protein